MENFAYFRQDVQILSKGSKIKDAIIQFINLKMNFMSERDSLAESFLSQTENNSYLISSRRRLLDDPENDLEDFKHQIQYKFIESVANKIYTYPLSQQAFDLLNDEQEFNDLLYIKQYNLNSQNKQQQHQKKGMFKIRHKNESKAADDLLESVRKEVDRIKSLRMVINQNLPSNITKTNRMSTETLQKKSSKVFNHDSSKNPKENRIYDIIYEEPEQLLNRKKRLLTEPYDKSSAIDKNIGYIIKRK